MVSSSKNMKILNSGGEISVPGGVAAVLEGSDDEAVDPHLNGIKNAREGGAGANADSDEEPAKEPEKKEPSASKSAAKKKKREEGDDDGKKKKRKKKDPNAPKGAMSSFMFFSQAEREKLKKTNRGLPFKDVGRVVGERWKKMTDEEKEPYEAQAKRDKTRYRAEMAEYRSGKGTTPPMGDQSSDDASK